MKNISKTFLAAVLVCSATSVSALEYPEITCDDLAKYSEKLGTSPLNGLVLETEDPKGMLKHITFAPYHNLSLEVRSQGQLVGTIQMVDTSVEDNVTRFHERVHRAHRDARGGQMFEFTQISDDRFEFRLYGEEYDEVTKTFKFTLPLPVFRNPNVENPFVYTLNATKESIKAAQNAKCKS
ncbi:hypothetical protein [Vibrio rhodolitus]|uniref:hypothetical protein n=1 Tax=Vibrio rhodolitus TaxID=2231649 RepID=UPI000E0BE0FE|nr:hypothetical protein [Vibrio rhodolitus]